jgi:hypothetical protein
VCGTFLGSCISVHETWDQCFTCLVYIFVPCRFIVFTTYGETLKVHGKLQYFLCSVTLWTLMYRNLSLWTSFRLELRRTVAAYIYALLNGDRFSFLERVKNKGAGVHGSDLTWGPVVECYFCRYRSEFHLTGIIFRTDIQCIIQIADCLCLQTVAQIGIIFCFYKILKHQIRSTLL